MGEGIVVILLLSVAGLIVIAPIVTLFTLFGLKQRQEETTLRLTRDLRSLQDALAREQELLQRLLKQGTAPAPSETAMPPSPVEKPPQIELPAEKTFVEEPQSEQPEGSEVQEFLEEVEESTSEQPTELVSGGDAEQPVPSARPIKTRAEMFARLHRERHGKGAAETSHEAFTPPPPREPSRFEVAAKETLRKIWNWIVVGEEHIPEGVSVEFAIASQWLLRIGVVLLVFGIGFFLKYSIERDLITPWQRVGLAAATGLALLVVGARILGGTYHLLGQGLLGAGVATLYFSVFAAANFYSPPLMDVNVAFGLMIAITALSGWLAVRFRSLLVAVLGVLGGYGTPVMLSTGVVNFVGLYGYMLVLGVGVLAVCSRKRWPLLNYLAFLCNYALVFASLTGYKQAEHFWQVMPFLIAFFVLFSTMVFIYNLAKRAKSNLLDVLVLFVNAGVFFGLSYQLIHELYGQKWVAASTLGLAVFYAAHVYYCLLRRVLDRELMISFLGLSAFFVTVTIPLVLSKEWITVNWSIQALVMLWIAGRLNSRFLQNVSYLLYLIVLFRFAAFDLVGQFRLGPATDLVVGEYLGSLIQRLVMFGVPIGSMAAAWQLLKHQQVSDRWAVDSTNDIPGGISRNWGASGIVVIAVGMLFLYLHLELNRTFGFFVPSLRLPGLTVLWLGMCAFLLLVYRETRHAALFALLQLFIGAVLLKLLIFDLPSWSVSDELLYGGPYRFPDAGMRLLDFGAIIAFLTWAFVLLRGSVNQKHVGVILGSLGLALSFIYTTLEVNTAFHQYLPGMRAGGVSILWSIYALTLLLFGIWNRISALRYVGLGLFSVVAAKVFFVDLAKLDQIYRIVAFIVLGVVVLAGSFLYMKYRHTFATDAESDGTESADGDAPALEETDREPREEGAE